MNKLSYIFLGALIGVALTIGGGAFAASTGLVGKKIVSEVPVVFNGKQIADRGSVADGTTLLPVRSMAELFGATTEYKDGKVYLTKEEGDSDVSGSTPSDSGSQTTKLTAEQIQKQIDGISDSIKGVEDGIDQAKQYIKDYPEDAKMTNMQSKLTELENKLNSLNQQKADLEAQLQALQNQ